MEVTPDKKKLMTLVAMAVEGDLALPEFQRNFVWSIPDVSDLLLSIFKGYFIGTFLMLRTGQGHSPFGCRGFAGVNGQASDKTPVWLVLDGQQRITALHYVFAAPPLPLKHTKHPYRFFLHLDKLRPEKDGDLPEDLVFCERADYCVKYLEPEFQFNGHLLPLTELRRWPDWQARYERWLIEKDRDAYFEKYHPQIKPVWDNAIGALQAFLVPVIEVPAVADDDTRGISEICAIFEKINSTGVRLSVYDLLTARLYKYGINLHELWEEAVEQHAQIKAFSGENADPDPYGLFVLRTLALLRGQEVRAKSLINLSPENFAEDWRNAAAAVEDALERLIAVNPDGFGVFDQRWQPYSTLVPVLAAALHTFKKVNAGPEAYAALKCWYWGSVFLERYAGSVETTTYRDAMDLTKLARRPDFRPAVFDDIRARLLNDEGFTLRPVARVNSVYKGVMNMIAVQGARDFANNDSIQFHELEDHHVFPAKHLANYGIQGERANTVLNRSLIAANTNQKIKDKPPSIYVKTILPDRLREGILRSHFIGPEAQTAMERDDYEGFLAAREKDILKYLRNLLEPAL
jgi:hypothetical protein